MLSLRKRLRAGLEKMLGVPTLRQALNEAERPLAAVDRLLVEVEVETGLGLEAAPGGRLRTHSERLGAVLRALRDRFDQLTNEREGERAERVKVAAVARQQEDRAEAGERELAAARKLVEEGRRLLEERSTRLEREALFQKTTREANDKVHLEIEAELQGQVEALRAERDRFATSYDSLCKEVIRLEAEVGDRARRGCVAVLEREWPLAFGMGCTPSPCASWRMRCPRLNWRRRRSSLPRLRARPVPPEQEGGGEPARPANPQMSMYDNERGGNRHSQRDGRLRPSCCSCIYGSINATPRSEPMNPMTLTNLELTAALNAAMGAVKETRGSRNLKRTRARVLRNLKAEAQRRVDIGAW